METPAESSVVSPVASLESVVISRVKDNEWIAHHVPSGKKTSGITPADAQDAMRILLGISENGTFNEPPTSDRFSGLAREIAEFLEGPVSNALALHSGYARLEAFEAGVAHVRLGGGCQGCPSSLITLLSGVRGQLQDKFGEDQITEVSPALE